MLTTMQRFREFVWLYWLHQILLMMVHHNAAFKMNDVSGIGRFLKPETVAGAVAGIVGTMLGYPFDSVKPRMQTTGLSIAGAYKVILQEAGITGFYRGIASPLLALTILNSLNFSCYSVFINQLSALGKFNETIKYLVAGGMVGPVASMISTPFEYIKIQLQIDKSSLRNSIYAVSHITKNFGVAKLYTGHAVNTVREMVFLSTYFTAYEQCKYTSNDFLHNSQISIPLSGGIAGALGWFVSFPLDSVKSQIQSKALSDISGRNSALVVFRKILAEKGLGNLYNGVVPSLLRAFIVSSTRFSAYEATMYLFDKIGKQRH